MKPTILVIDDEENMLLLLNRILGKEGYEVITASSGAKGLKQMQERSFHLLILDQQISDMNGIQFLENLREESKALPVIMITAFPSWEKEEQAKALGCRDYLQKPLDIKLLKEKVKKYIGKI